MMNNLKPRPLWTRIAIVLCTAWLTLAAADDSAARNKSKSIESPQKEDKKAQDQDAPRGADRPTYFIASQVDWIPLLAPPPEANSPEQQRDLQTVLDMQTANGKGSARRETAIADTEASCFRIMLAVDPKLDAKKVPKTAEFLKKAANEGDQAAGVLKTYWKRARPFVVSSKVERLGDIDPENIKKKQQEQKEKEARRNAQQGNNAAPGGNNPPPGMNGPGPNEAGPGAPPGMNPPNGNAEDAKLSPEEREKKQQEEQKRQLEYSSYPSGHSTFGTLCAAFIAQMVPEKQAQIFKRADEYRQSRLIVGAHFPTDIEGGRIVGTAAAALMSQNYAFQRDLATARAELRNVLGLPAELPSREKTENKDKEAAVSP